MRVLEGRGAIISGANQGLGFAISRAYVLAGASVLLCARTGDLLEKARTELAAGALPNQVVASKVADVSRSDDVNAVIETALDLFPQVHILVNNAGVYGPKGLTETVDWDEWRRAIEINLMGSVLMCRNILPHMKSLRYGKIIQLSGGGATKPLPRLSAYAAAKAAIVRFTETLAEEVYDDHIDVNAMAPGALNTRMLEEVLAAGPGRIGEDAFKRARKQQEEGGAPLHMGADLAVFLGSGASDGISGKLISAIWDPWQEFPAHMDDLKNTDVYTLRRIVPKDRQLDWGDK